MPPSVSKPVRYLYAAPTRERPLRRGYEHGGYEPRPTTYGQEQHPAIQYLEIRPRAHAHGDYASSPATHEESHRAPQFLEIRPRNTTNDGRGREPAAPSRDAVREQQQAYNTRGDSLGYGGRSSSLQRTFKIPRAVQLTLNEITECDRNIKLIQITAQLYHPSLNEYGKAGMSGGVCNGMTREWLDLHSRHSSEGASRRFGRTLNEDMGKLAHWQDKLNATRANLRSLEGTTDDHEMERLARRMREGEAANLPWIRQTSGDFSSDPRSAARQVLQGMREDGFYRICMQNNRQGTGHVMGAWVSRDRNEFKLMDPNTGEFSANNRESFLRLLEKNIDLSDYHQEFNKLFVHQHNAE